MGAGIAFGEAATYEPGRSGIDFDLGAGSDRVTVKVVIATFRLAQHGTIRVTAQAILRQAPAP